MSLPPNTYGGKLTNTSDYPQAWVTRNGWSDIAEHKWRSDFMDEDIPGRIVFYKYCNTNDRECQAINSQEWLFSRTTPSFRKIGVDVRNTSLLAATQIDDGAPLMFTALNHTGTFASKDDIVQTQEQFDALPTARKLAYIESHFVFRGLAKTHVDFSEFGLEAKNGRKTFAFLIGGLESTINWGCEPVEAGDWIEWCARDPDPSQRDMYPPFATDVHRKDGIPRKKIMFCCRPVKWDEIVSYDAVREAMDLPAANQRGGNQHNNHFLERPSLINWEGYEDEQGLPYILDSFANSFAKFVTHVAAVVEAKRGGTAAQKRDAYKRTVDAYTDEEHHTQLKALLADVMQFQTSKDFMERGEKKYMWLSQSAAKDLFHGFGKVLCYRLSKVVGRAVTTAAPGHQYSLFIGHGSVH
jgi:hypothetical protein